MSKYNSNAGFKNYDVSLNDTDTKAESESKVSSSPLSKYKSSILIAGAVIATLVIVAVVFVFLSPTEEREPQAPTIGTQAIAESLDYEELFQVETTELITIENPYAKLYSTTKPQTTAPLPRAEHPYTKATVPTTVAPTSKPAAISNSSQSSRSSGSGNGGNSVSNNSGGNVGSGGNTSNSNSSSSGNNGSGSSTHQRVQEQYTPKTISVSEIRLSTTNVNLTVGGTARITAEVVPSNASDTRIIWGSADNSIAEIVNGNSGQIKAVGIGTTTIYASCGGKRAACTVVVKQKADSYQNVSITPEHKTVRVGEQVVVQLKNASSCRWDISHPFVLEQYRSIGTTFIVTAKKSGVANVIATLPNGKTYKCIITVK